MLLNLVSHSLDGHRREYVALMARLFGEGGVETRLLRRWRDAAAASPPAFFLMVEENCAGYAAAALWRAVMGRRTVGLLFRGREALEGKSPRLRLKRWGLRLLRRVPGVTTLSIVPFRVEPGLAEIADDWIDDPQLWDLEDLSPEPTPLSEAVRGAAAGRRLVVSLGIQNEAKGFCFLAGAWSQSPSLRADWLFVAAGKVASEELPVAAEFVANGGYLVDRFISDAELASLYKAADVIWGVYAPFYDQASGIFGRAVQYDVPILLRRGSAVETHGLELGARLATVEYGVTGDLAGALEAAAAAEVSRGNRAPEMRARSEAILRAALMGCS